MKTFLFIVGYLLMCGSVYAMGWLDARMSISKRLFEPWLDRIHGNDPHFAVRMEDWRQAWDAYVGVPRPWPIRLLDPLTQWLVRRFKGAHEAP